MYSKSVFLARAVSVLAILASLIYVGNLLLPWLLTFDVWDFMTWGVIHLLGGIGITLAVKGDNVGYWDLLLWGPMAWIMYGLYLVFVWPWLQKPTIEAPKDF